MATWSSSRTKPAPRVFLVGSTGHGKSRFGSYLTDPKATIDAQNPAFKFSESSAAVTSQLTCKQIVFEKTAFDIVDTPGFGENPAADLQHTIQLLQMMNKSQQVAAIVFCFRQGRVEDTAKGLIDFLKRVFDKKMIAKNLVLVVTHVSQSKGAERQRQASGKPLAELLHDTADTISKAFGLATRLPCFDIDTNPDSLAAEEHALTRRQAILEAIRACPLVHVQYESVPKTTGQILEDQAALAELRTKLKACKASMAELQQEFDSMTSAIQASRASIAELEADLDRIEEYLSEINTEELVETGRDEGSRGMHHSHPLRLEVTAEHPIAEQRYCLRDDEDVAWVESPSDCRRILFVEPSSGYWGSSWATLVVFSYMKDVMRHEVLAFQSHAARLTATKTRLDIQCVEMEQQCTGARRQMWRELLHDEMHLTAQCDKMQLKTMLLADAEARLQFMKQSGAAH